MSSKRKQAATKEVLEESVQVEEINTMRYEFYDVKRGDILFFIEISALRSWLSTLLRDFRFAGTSVNLLFSFCLLNYLLLTLLLLKEYFKINSNISYILYLFMYLLSYLPVLLRLCLHINHEF